MAEFRLGYTKAGRDDRGFTLVELVVAMGIFTIFIALFLAAVVGLTRGTTKAQVSAEATTGVLTVFKNVDRQVRYADAISVPGEGPTGRRYVEFRTPASSTADGIAKCTQWRFVPTTGRIDSREWTDTVGAIATPWATKLTTAIPMATPTYPFALLPAVQGGATKQRLVMTINAGNADIGAVTEVTSTFVARNSSLSSITNVCQNLTSGSRP